MNKEVDYYEEVYPCHGETQKRWFKVFVTPCEYGAIICHADLTNEGESGLPIANKDAFLGNIHDLRTPLTIIIGFAKLMKLEFSQTKKVNRLGDFLESINSSAQLLLQNVNDLVLNSTNKAEDEKNLDVKIRGASFLDEIVLEIEPLLESNNIRVIKNFDQNLIQLIPTKTYKNIVINLISNAIKYNKPNGEVYIKLSKNLSGGCELSIRDSGIGISEEQLSQIFNIYHRVEVGDSFTEGSGIGLANVHRLVAEIEGNIEVTSKIGEGSCFRVLFPAWRTV